MAVFSKKPHTSTSSYYLALAQFTNTLQSLVGWKNNNGDATFLLLSSFSSWGCRRLVEST
jgi:hypothetical protein